MMIFGRVVYLFGIGIECVYVDFWECFGVWVGCIVM